MQDSSCFLAKVRFKTVKQLQFHEWSTLSKILSKNKYYIRNDFNKNERRKMLKLKNVDMQIRNKRIYSPYIKIRKPNLNAFIICGMFASAETPLNIIPFYDFLHD